MWNVCAKITKSGSLAHEYTPFADFTFTAFVKHAYLAEGESGDDGSHAGHKLIWCILSTALAWSNIHAMCSSVK